MPTDIPAPRPEMEINQHLLQHRPAVPEGRVRGALPQHLRKSPKNATSDRSWARPVVGCFFYLATRRSMFFMIAMASP
jgi:hypothetical protein